MANDTISYTQLEKLLTRILNQLAERDQETQEEKQNVQDLLRAIGL